MARRPRLSLPGELHHVLWRGHPGQAVLEDSTDRDSFVRMLRDALPSAGVALHAYVVLPGEVHLLATPAHKDSLGRLMQSLGRRFGADFNRRHGRQGAVWDGRFRCSLLEAERYLLDAIVLLETMPVVRGLVSHPADWRWSSAAHRLGRAREPALSDHPRYWIVGNTPFERERAHAQLLERGIAPTAADMLERAVLRSLVVGSEGYLARLAQAAHRSLAPRPRGRPPKARLG